MIDKLTLFLPHLLMAIAVWRLLKRDDLDNDPSLPSRRAPFRKMGAKPPGGGDA